MLPEPVLLIGPCSTFQFMDVNFLSFCLTAVHAGGSVLKASMRHAKIACNVHAGKGMLGF